MKKLFVVALSMMIFLAASAQHKSVVNSHYYYHPGTHVVVGVNGYYPYYSVPLYNYYWGYPTYYGRPSKLEMQIQDIKSDYKDRIWSARHDDRLSKEERKTEIHQLKKERDEAIRDAERNYHRRDQ